MHVEKNIDLHPCAKNDFVRKNLEILIHNESFTTVIISFYSWPYFQGSFLNKTDINVWGTPTLKSTHKDELRLTNQELIYSDLRRTINQIYAQNKKIIFLRETPQMEENFKDFCYQDIYKNKGGAINCRIPIESYRAKEVMKIP